MRTHISFGRQLDGLHLFVRVVETKCQRSRLLGLVVDCSGLRRAGKNRHSGENETAHVVGRSEVAKESCSLGTCSGGLLTRIIYGMGISPGFTGV